MIRFVVSQLLQSMNNKIQEVGMHEVIAKFRFVICLNIYNKILREEIFPILSLKFSHFLTLIK